MGFINHDSHFEDINHLWEHLQHEGVEIIRLIYSDMHGVARGKDIALESIESAVEYGVTFCTSSLTDGLASNTTFAPGLPAVLGYPDMRAKLVPSTLTFIPYEQRTVLGLADLENDRGPIELSPRNLLKRVEELYHKLGLRPIVGPEIEFFLVKKDEQGRISRYTNEYSNEYTVGPRSDPKGIIRVILNTGKDMGIHVIAASHEYCRGQYEINVAHGNALDVADKIFYLKLVIKDLAAHHGLLATFMGRPFNDDAGSGFHVHLSVSDDHGNNLFASSESDSHLSEVGKHFIAGVLEHAPGLMAFFAPTINAYKRFGSNSLVSTTVNWAYDNRTSFIRVPAEYGAHTRLEIRAPDASANPYLVIAASLLAGLDGIQHQLIPPSPLSGNLSTQKLDSQDLPSTLNESLIALLQDTYLCEKVGESLIKAFHAMKKTEIERFQNYVTDWELNEYMWHL
jgi:glutamine synthetase